MARTRWSFKNYNAVLREFKRSEGLTHRQAQEAYRQARKRLGPSLFAVDLKRRRDIRLIAASEAIKEPRQAPVLTFPGSSALSDRELSDLGSGAFDFAQLPEDVDPIDAWEEAFDFWDDLIDEEYEGDEDYKEA